MKQKREVVAFIPYRYKEGMYEFFLQKRDEGAPIHANMFSTFGGGTEKGESSEEGMMREVSEELTYTPRHATYFDRYETNRHIYEVFFEKVGDDFEQLVEVREGEYGRFLTESEVVEKKDVTPIAKLIIEEFCAQSHT